MTIQQRPTIDQIKTHFGNRRYFELRDEAWNEWLGDPKTRGVSVRYYILNYLQKTYVREIKQLEESDLVARLDGGC